MNQIFLASTLFGAMNLAAAIDEGQFGAADENRRTLLVSTNSVIPEATTPLHRMTGADPILSRFDRVVDWNDAIAPFHPAEFTNLGITVVTSRWFRSHAGIDDGPVELILESIQVSPAQTIAKLFTDSPIVMYSDGLMSYGPTRVELPLRIGRGIERLVHLDLVPGLQPQLLREFEVPTVPLDDAYFRKLIDEVAAATPEVQQAASRLPTTGRPSLILGQYLGALGLMSDREEADLYGSMVRELADGGSDHVVFKPHPTAPWKSRAVISAAADQAGVALTVLDDPIPLELLLTQWKPSTTAGCFSTGLLVAERFFGLDVAAYGTRELLARLSPFENSNRIPLVIVDAVVPQLSGSAPDGVAPSRLSGLGDIPGLQGLVEAVAYNMQPKLHHDRRTEVEAFLAQFSGERVSRYFHAGRLASLGIGPVPPSFRWRAKQSLRRTYEATTGFQRRHPTIGRLARSVRHRVSIGADSSLARMPSLRRIIKRLVRGTG